MAREIEKSLLITNLVKLADELRMNPIRVDWQT